MTTEAAPFEQRTYTPKPIKLVVPNPISSPPTTEIEKMVSGIAYDPFHPQIVDGRAYARIKQREFAQISPLEPATQRRVLSELLGTASEGAYIEPPCFFDYGSNTHFGKGSYANYNCVFLDVAPIRLGDRVMLASGVQLLTATHPVDVATRNSGIEYGHAITIGNDCWLGGGVIVCPGVTIGEGSVVGAGAVVTKDVAPYSVVVGNPARKIRDLPRTADAKAAAIAETGSAAVQ